MSLTDRFSEIYIATTTASAAEASTITVQGQIQSGSSITLTETTTSIGTTTADASTVTETSKPLDSVNDSTSTNVVLFGIGTVVGPSGQDRMIMMTTTATEQDTITSYSTIAGTDSTGTFRTLLTNILAETLKFLVTTTAAGGQASYITTTETQTTTASQTIYSTGMVSV